MRFLGLAVLVLAGCRTPAPVEPIPAVDRNAENVALLADWSLRGKLGLANQDRAWSGSLKWQQRGDDYAIELSGPLGAGLIRIDGNPGHARVSRGDEIRMADSPDVLAEALLGHPFPVSSLVDWILGQPSTNAGAEVIERDVHGYPVKFRQQQWLVRIDEYALHAGVRLPVRLVAESSAGRITLFVSSWQVPEA